MPSTFAILPESESVTDMVLHYVLLNSGSYRDISVKTQNLGIFAAKQKSLTQ